MAVTKKPVKKPAAKKSEPAPIEAKASPDTYNNQEEKACCNDMTDLMAQVKSAVAMDIAHLSRLGRIMFMDFLSCQGYKTMRITDLTDDLQAAANAEVLKFNHVNKVVEFIDHNDLIGCPAISKVYLEVHVNLDITKAEPYHPETLTQGNAMYVRVK